MVSETPWWKEPLKADRRSKGKYYGAKEGSSELENVCEGIDEDRAIRLPMGSKKLRMVVETREAVSPPMVPAQARTKGSPKVLPKRIFYKLASSEMG
jgi:hypothetical protein